MKILLIFSLCFVISNNISAQLTANAGGEKHVCSNDTLTYILGGSSTATGGVPPYTYAWYIKPIKPWTWSTTIFYTKDLLKDTSLANAKIIDPYIKDTIKIYLKVTDSLNNIAIDSSIVITSNFVYLIGDYDIYMHQGDSAHITILPNLSTNQQVVSYLWQPNAGLTDSTKESNFWVKPDTTTNYYVTITDVLGCKATGSPFLHVNILPNSLKENKKTNEITVYPNPTNDNLYFDISFSQNYKIEFYDLLGINKIYSNANYVNLSAVSTHNLSAGTYIYKITTKEKIFVSKFSIIK